MGPDLLRQRRNLLVVSLALIAVNLAGAEFNKLAVMGTELTFSRRWVLSAGGWILWAYFFLRYVQHMLAEGDLGIENAIYIRLMDYHTKKFPDFPYLQCEKSGWLLWRFNAAKTYSPEKGNYAYAVSPASRATIIFWIAKANVAVAVKTPRVTDYVLPIMVGLMAPVSAAFMLCS